MVYVGDAICPVIEYYTTDSLLVCVAPPCTANECLSSSDFRGSATVDLSIYIQTVETILSASTPYTYSYYSTPIVTQLGHNTWATASTPLVGRLITSSLADISIKINNQYASLGDNQQLNSEKISYPSNIDNLLYYRPPTDMASGFYNLTLTVQNSQSLVGPGLAKMFDQNYPFDFMYNSTFGYYYRSTLSGIPYLVTLFPTISFLSTDTGSVAGGTLLKIKGYGFPHDITALVIYAAGELCQVQSVTSDTITCLTSPSSLLKTQQSSIVSTIQQNAATSSSLPFLDSARVYGSSGAWVKLWSYNDNTFGSDDTALLSFPWRDGLAFSLWYNYGASRWPMEAGIASNLVTFQADIRTILVAPFTGNYTFYINADDSAILYDGNNRVLCSATTWQYPNAYYVQTSQKSSPVFLKRGDRYPLRITTINYAANDQTFIAMKLRPQYKSDSVTLVDYTPGKSQSPTGELPIENVPASLSDSLVRLHGLKEIQKISFTYQHTYETQVRLNFS